MHTIELADRGTMRNELGSATLRNAVVIGVSTWGPSRCERDLDGYQSGDGRGRHRTCTSYAGKVKDTVVKEYVPSPHPFEHPFYGA